MVRQIEALQDNLERVIFQFASGTPDHKMGSACALLKVNASKTMEFCAREASQVFGGAAIVKEGQGKVHSHFARPPLVQPHFSSNLGCQRSAVPDCRAHLSQRTRHGDPRRQRGDSARLYHSAGGRQVGETFAVQALIPNSAYIYSFVVCLRCECDVSAFHSITNFSTAHVDSQSNGKSSPDSACCTAATCSNER